MVVFSSKAENPIFISKLELNMWHFKDSYIGLGLVDVTFSTTMLTREIW